MEYFDFEEASFAARAKIAEDDIASDCQEVDESDAVENYDALFFDKTFQLPPNVVATHLDNPLSDLDQGLLAGTTAVDISSVPDAVPGEDYPMFRATEPCDFCRRMGLNCFLIQRGVLNNGCTCCVSLYRECSFTHAKAPGKFLETLHPVNEDIDIPTGGLTGKRVLKSLGQRNSDDFEGRGRKPGARFSRDALRVLKNWLSEHYQHPYPTEDEKHQLKERTGLGRGQISNWLANARRRGKVRPSPGSTSPVLGAVDVPGRSSSSSASASSVDLSLMTPLERWKHSPPEHEAASTTAIIRAIANPPFPGQQALGQPQQQQQQLQSGHVRSSSRKTASSNDSSYSSLFQAPSMSSLDTENKSSTSDFSFASAFSHRSSLNSMASMASKDGKERRRRRKQGPPVPAFERQKNRGARVFQCTFCTDSFLAKYDWQRHEKSLHLALEKWACAPQGGIITTSDGKEACAFCRAPNPTKEHLEMHNYFTCQEKTVQERTFYRKDHLNQHLRLMHDVKFDPWMEHWRSATTEIKSRCGFCEANFTTWKDRVDHLARHFKSGADMAQWKGDWGFEPFVKRLVENAVPPYLIGQERASLDPYKASARDLSKPATGSHDEPKPLSTNLPVPTDENCFERLELALKAFIHHSMQAGVIPTDQSIQDEARTTIYGTDDPWNQTCADSPVWLNILKRDCGLETVSDSEHIELQNLGMQPPYAAAGGLPRPPLETNPLAGHWRGSWVTHSSLHSVSDLRSPGLPSAGFQSAAPSVPGSLAGSYVDSGSIGVSSAANLPGLTSGWSSSLSAGGLSSSAPIGTSMNAPTHSFDAEFLEQMNSQYWMADCMDGIDGTGHDMQRVPSNHSAYVDPSTKDEHSLYESTAAEAHPIPIGISPASIDPNLSQYGTDPLYRGSGFQ
jgi:hypothetical protein